MKRFEATSFLWAWQKYIIYELHFWIKKKVFWKTENHLSRHKQPCTSIRPNFALRILWHRALYKGQLAILVISNKLHDNIFPRSQPCHWQWTWVLPWSPQIEAHEMECRGGRLGWGLLPGGNELLRRNFGIRQQWPGQPIRAAGQTQAATIMLSRPSEQKKELSMIYLHYFLFIAFALRFLDM